MADEYFPLYNTVELPNAAQLQYERARSLAEALEQHRDFSTVQLLRGTTEPALDVIVADVECDGVPPDNRHGIGYRERIALLISGDPRALVQVYALRKTFPRLMHQNQTAADQASNLCLYFEPPAAVLRTWTPQRFLHRIRWWLEMSARDALHPADQPVEALFFMARDELVLPWNYEALRKSKDHRLNISITPERPDRGSTCIIEAVAVSAKQDLSAVTLIPLELSPVVHGTVEPHPPTLGDLNEVMQRRGVDLLSALQEAVREQASKGAAAKSDTKLTIILLHIPIARRAGEEASAMEHRAFVIGVGGLRLGESLGALFNMNGTYQPVQSIGGTELSGTWRSLQVEAMSVSRFNDDAASRRQSGIADAGPRGVLIGAGSLGSALLNLWGRCGWGQWTVVDKDHIKPHNLARHVALADHVGAMKADVVAHLHSHITRDASTVTPINADACEFQKEPLATTLKTAALVVDASTTLEYPRAISAQEGVARHVSVFITPNGNSAVLLAEDAERRHRLRSLEAQYYRALIEHEWGGTHLDGAKTFWSGASCRDISLVLPYSRIQAHACTLAEQIPLANAQPDARIRIWQRDPEGGTVTLHSVPVRAERLLSFGEHELFMDDGLEHSLREQRRAKLPNETGGVLLGYYDLNIKAIFLVAALPAPPDSKGSAGAFERGTEGLQETIAEIARRTAGIVGYVGEWHSHPRGHSARPSRDDLVQLAHLAKAMADEGLPAVQLIVGENDISLLQGTVLATG
jgi:integrative and conjugative element protein (TIGR02256 family)